MKEKIIAICLFALVITFVVINTIILDIQIEKMCDAVEAINISENSLEDAEYALREIFEEYKRREVFISLTVNHEDLTNIEESFDEIIGYLSVRDADGARVTKNRLVGSLRHLRRLSGLNIDAII